MYTYQIVITNLTLPKIRPSRKGEGDYKERKTNASLQETTQDYVGIQNHTEGYIIILSNKFIN